MRMRTRSPVKPCMSRPPSSPGAHGDQLARDGDTEPRTEERQRDAEQDVQARTRMPALLDKEHGVVGECREGGVAPAKARGEERAHLRGNDVRRQRITEHEAEEKRPRYVDDKSADGEVGADALLNER